MDPRQCTRTLSVFFVTTLATLLCSLALVACAGPDARRSAQTVWIAGWMSAPSFRPASPRDNERVAYSGESVRQDVRLGLAGDHLRLRLSNELGDAPIEVGRVQVATLAAGDTPQTPVTARFAGKESVTLAPGEALNSDSFPLNVPAFTDIAISIYYPGTARPVTHRLMVRVAAGPDMPGNSSPAVRGPAIVSAVEVAKEPAAVPAVIVAFGDSITEGARSTAHNDWPSVLARRLDQSCPGGFVVLNAGISGNHVLSDGGSPSALSRVDRDVLSHQDVSKVILLEGINDIRQLDDSGKDPAATNPSTADQLLAADRQIVERLHARGIKVIGGTLAPYKGTARQSAQGLATVARLNEAIRDGGLFDDVVDFYATLDDPADPGRMRAELQSGDWLHPGDLGYAAMAQAIPTSLLGGCKAKPH